MNKKTFLVALILLIGVSLAGCKSTNDKVTEKSIEVGSQGKLSAEVYNQGKRVKVTDKESGGSLEVDQDGSLGIPDIWPVEIGIYPQSKIISVFNNQDNVQFVAQTTEETDKLIKWYTDKIGQTDWKKLNSLNMGDSWLGSYKKGDYQLNIMIGPNEDGEGNIISHNYNKAK